MALITSDCVLDRQALSWAAAAIEALQAEPPALRARDDQLAK